MHLKKSEMVKYPTLTEGYILRKFESPIVYGIYDDELYELDEEALHFLTECDGTHTGSELFKNKEICEAVKFMIDEGILIMKNEAGQRKITIPVSPEPSLRYLLLNITDKCNLACKHCYLGNSGSIEMNPGIFERTVSQFEEMGGIKLMISGGEPLLHSKLDDLLSIIPSFDLRIVVLSNGTLIDGAMAEKLSNFVDEVQVSIDGLKSHDLLRGKGSYERSMTGISNLIRSGVKVSIASMIHKFNKEEFDEMERLFSSMDILSWSVDAPCVKGNLEKNMEFVLNYNEAAKYLAYGFGSGVHESTGNHICGSHMCSVSPDGRVSKCGFFEDTPAGDIGNLRAAWNNLSEKYLFSIDKLDCHECPEILNCRGGCRFRAIQYRSLYAPDPLLCHAKGILKFL